VPALEFLFTVNVTVDLAPVSKPTTITEVASAALLPNNVLPAKVVPVNVVPINV
jgi:hypothetical protein